jgi:hypothetical protein
MTVNTPETYLTLPYIARELRLSYMQVYVLLLTGKIDGQKIHGQWHIDPISFEQYRAQLRDDR